MVYDKLAILVEMENELKAVGRGEKELTTELLAEANKWELSHGGLSGRTAAQFITHLLGRR